LLTAVWPEFVTVTVMVADLLFPPLVVPVKLTSVGDRYDAEPQVTSPAQLTVMTAAGSKPVPVTMKLTAVFLLAETGEIVDSVGRGRGASVDTLTGRLALPPSGFVNVKVT